MSLSVFDKVIHACSIQNSHLVPTLMWLLLIQTIVNANVSISQVRWTATGNLTLNVQSNVGQL